MSRLEVHTDFGHNRHQCALLNSRERYPNLSIERVLLEYNNLQRLVHKGGGERRNLSPALIAEPCPAVMRQHLHIERHVFSRIQEMGNGRIFYCYARGSKLLLEKPGEVNSRDRPEEDVCPETVKRSCRIHDQIIKHSGLGPGEDITNAGVHLDRGADLALDFASSDFNDSLEFVDDKAYGHAFRLGCCQLLEPVQCVYQKNGVLQLAGFNSELDAPLPVHNAVIQLRAEH
jgi:hypothetical protein